MLAIGPGDVDDPVRISVWARQSPRPAADRAPGYPVRLLLHRLSASRWTGCPRNSRTSSRTRWTPAGAWRRGDRRTGRGAGQTRRRRVRRGPTSDPDSKVSMYDFGPAHRTSSARSAAWPSRTSGTAATPSRATWRTRRAAAGGRAGAMNRRPPDARSGVPVAFAGRARPGRRAGRLSASPPDWHSLTTRRRSSPFVGHQAGDVPPSG